MPEAHGSGRSPGLRPAFFVSLLCMLCYFLMLNGGIGSADSEVVFRTAKSLADSGSWAVRQLERWPGFGMATGTDGKSYSVFGPGEAVVLVPFVRLAEAVVGTGWLRHVPVPPSSYAGPSYGSLTELPVERDPTAHAERLVVSVCYLLAGGAAVFLFWILVHRLTNSVRAATVSALLFGIGSLQWAYASTLFSESLVVAFSLGAFLLLDPPPAAYRRQKLLLSGLLLGAAIATHITALLFVPFTAGYAFARARTGGRVRDAVTTACVHLIGIAVVCLLLGWHNASRFGSVWETGRSLDPGQIREFGYGFFVAPWQGLFGLTLSWGKGIALYSPAVVLALAGWRHLFRSDRILGLTLAGMIVVRVLFVAARYDWAGGFCLGPRLLVPVLPFCLVPFGFWLAGTGRPAAGWKREMWGVLALYACTVHQFYLQVGDVFHFYNVSWLFGQMTGVNVFKDWMIYFSPEYSPLLHILASRVSPFLWAQSGITTQLLFSAGVLLLTVLCCLGLLAVNKHSRAAAPAAVSHG